MCELDDSNMVQEVYSETKLSDFPICPICRYDKSKTSVCMWMLDSWLTKCPQELLELRECDCLYSIVDVWNYLAFSDCICLVVVICRVGNLCILYHFQTMLLESSHAKPSMELGIYVIK